MPPVEQDIKDAIKTTVSGAGSGYTVVEGEYKALLNRPATKTLVGVFPSRILVESHDPRYIANAEFLVVCYLQDAYGNLPNTIYAAIQDIMDALYLNATLGVANVLGLFIERVEVDLMGFSPSAAFTIHLRIRYHKAARSPS